MSSQVTLWRYRESLGERWCFVCRERREFFCAVLVVHRPSSCKPHASIRCGYCNALDGDLFPGKFRNWELDL